MLSSARDAEAAADLHRYAGTRRTVMLKMKAKTTREPTTVAERVNSQIHQPFTLRASYISCGKQTSAHEESTCSKGIGIKTFPRLSSVDALKASIKGHSAGWVMRTDSIQI